MKKSKFLQSSKDMISRSFNPAKCKTSLRLAESRLKLLRNKKEVQVKQMKREIAQLLESGQDRTARIRVEHVVREEKMMAAYDLIEIYCELIVARLPIIESQKTCPIDLKEAISSVIFASPRCGDVPELVDVRKQLTAKYGKEFTTAAVELRPACGVGRMLIEKLSTAAPDGQAKIKILTAIADEHNIKWDPSSLEEKESVPSNDLLNGPSNLKKESNVYAEPSRFEAPDVQAPPSRNNIHIPPPNFQQEDPRISLGAEKLAHTGVSTTVQPKDRPAALGVRRSQQFQEDGDTFSPGRHRFRMEFKDATSAAQAAADSAELASMAARAAAELSSGGRISRQYSTESHKSDVYVLKNEGPEPYSPSKFNNQKISEEHMDRLLSEHTMLRNEQKDCTKASNLKTERKSKEDDYDGTKAYNNSASLKSKASTGDEFLDHSGSAVDGYSRKNSLKGDSRGEMRVNKQSFSYDAEGGDNWVEKSENFREERIGKESINSSRSHSGISDDVNIFATAAGEDTSVATGKEQVNEKASQKSTHESASLFYEKNDSDSEDHGFDLGPQYDEQDLEFHLPSPSKAKDHFSINKESWYPGSSASKIVKSDPSLFFTTKNSPPDLSENLTVTHGSELDDFMPVAFDDSDGPTFESDEDMNMSRHRWNRDSSNLPSKHKESRQPVVSPYNEKERSGSDRKQFPQSYDDELKHEETPEVRNQGKNIDVDPAENFSLGKPSIGNPDLGFKEERYQVEPIVFDQERSPDRGEGLKFEKLTGGLRHKGHRHRPYLKNHLDESSSAKEESISSSAFVAESPKKSRVSDHKKNTRRSKLNYDLSSDSSEEEDFPLKKVGNTEKEVKTESRFRASNSVFDSDSDFEEDARKGYPVSVKPHLRGGISRRTKASPSSPGANSYSNMRVRAEALDSGAVMDRKPKSSFMSEAAIEPDKSGHSENYEQSTSLKPASRPAKSSYWGPPEQSNSPKTAAVVQGRAQGKSYLPDSEASAGSKQTNSYSPETQEEVFPPRRKSSQVRNPEQPKKEKTSLATVQESKISLKSSELEEPSISKPKKEVSSSGSEKPKASTLNKSDSSKASHVHPKLPDYDMLLQSFQRNRP